MPTPGPVVERAKQVASRLQNLATTISNLPIIVTPSNSSSAEQNNEEENETTRITPRRLEFTTELIARNLPTRRALTTDEEALLSTDTEDTMTEQKTTYEQILTQVKTQLTILKENLEPTPTPTLTQVWSLQQALANVLASVKTTLSLAGLAFIIEREEAWKIRMGSNSATIPTFPVKPVSPTTGAIAYRNYETAAKEYQVCDHYDDLCVQVYRGYFVGKFRRIETVPGQKPVNKRARDYHDYLVDKLGRNMNKEEEYIVLSQRIFSITYRPNPNGPIETFRTVQRLRSLIIELGYTNHIPESQVKTIMLAKFGKCGHKQNSINKIQAAWTKETDQSLDNFIEFWCDELEALYDSGETGEDDEATAHMTSEFVDAVVDEATARVQEQI